MGPRKTVTALSQADRDAILELIREENKRVRNTQQRPREGAVDHEEFPAPEHYVALAPHGGIPAVTVNEFETGTGTGTGTGTTFGDDVPGSAICQIYQLIKEDDADVSGTLKMVPGEVKRVYNANRVKVQAGSWVNVLRDKFETWWAVGPVIGGSSSTSICEEITVVTNVCIDFMAAGGGAGTATGTSGPVDALIVEYSTYNLQTCELVDRWCVRNPMACCLTCGGNRYPEFIYCTLSQTVGTGCLCADGLELVLRYQGIGTTGIYLNNHYWRAGPVLFGSCTIQKFPGPTFPPAYITLDLIMGQGDCQFTQNLLISDNAASPTVCANSQNGITVLSLNPFHVQGVRNGGATISCNPDCNVSGSDVLIFDYTA